MTKLWIDPPEGWRWGFPKIWNREEYPDMIAWLDWAGYPAEVRKGYGVYFYCRQWGVEEQE
jgi:hypothetical protein